MRLRDNLRAGHMQWDGGLGWQAIAVWYVIALSTLVEPAFYQRCFPAESERTAKNGIFWAIGFWVVFDFLMTTAGLYARALLPDLANPVQAFPALAAHVLPSFWQGRTLRCLKSWRRPYLIGWDDPCVSSTPSIYPHVLSHLMEALLV